MKISTKILGAFGAVLLAGSVNAQCNPGEYHVTVDVLTDTYGYETYWQATPNGDPCGTNTIVEFGNSGVGCAGGGAQVVSGAEPGAFGNNVNEVDTIGCFVGGTCIDIHIVDDWGDGGGDFTVLFDGVAGPTHTHSGANSTMSFCTPVNYDAAIDSIVGYEYTMVPMTQADVALGARIANAGLMDLTNAAVNVDVMTGGSSAFNATSTAVATLTPMNSQLENFANFAPSAMGTHDVMYFPSMDETDESSINDTVTYSFEVTDTVMARDWGTANGTLGIGAGPADDGRLGQTFHISTDGQMTSVTAMFGDSLYGTPTSGDSVSFMVYDMASGMPNAVVASTGMYYFTDADTVNGVWITLALDNALNVTAGTDYVVCVAEYGNNCTVGTDASNFTAGATWVNWANNPNGNWSNNEDFGFNTSYMIRANINEAEDTSSITELTQGALNVYPNPSKGTFTVEVSNVDATEMNVVVTNLAGQVVANELVNNNSFTTISLENATEGVYLVEVKGDNVVATERIVITK